MTSSRRQPRVILAVVFRPSDAEFREQGVEFMIADADADPFFENQFDMLRLVGCLLWR